MGIPKLKSYSGDYPCKHCDFCRKAGILKFNKENGPMCASTVDHYYRQQGLNGYQGLSPVDDYYRQRGLNGYQRLSIVDDYYRQQLFSNGFQRRDIEQEVLIETLKKCMDSYPNYRVSIPESIAVYSRSGSHIATYDSFGQFLLGWLFLGVILLLIVGLLSFLSWLFG